MATRIYLRGAEITACTVRSMLDRLMPHKEMKMIQLGQEVRCRITGVRGIATCRAEYLFGCVRISVQPKGKGDSVPEPVYIDEPQLEVVGKGFAAGVEYRHGDRPAPMGRSDPTR